MSPEALAADAADRLLPDTLTVYLPARPGYDGFDKQTEPVVTERGTGVDYLDVIVHPDGRGFTVRAGHGVPAVMPSSSNQFEVRMADRE